MEPPLKRARYEDSDDEENQDELSFHPVQFDAIQDPGYKLEKGRAKAATRLKSTFEDIFEKYGKDFSGDDDVINFYTDEVEIDNGHLQSLESRNLGGDEDDTSDFDGDRSEEGKTAKSIASRKEGQPGNSILKTSLESKRAPQRLSSWAKTSAYRPSSFAGADPPFSFGNSSNPNKVVDPIWQAPDLPAQHLRYSNSFGDLFANHGPRRLASARSLIVRHLSASPEADARDTDEDDILLGTTEEDINETPISPEAAKDKAEGGASIPPAEEPRLARRNTPSSSSKLATLGKRSSLKNVAPKSQSQKANATRPVKSLASPKTGTRCVRCSIQKKGPCVFENDAQTCNRCIQAGASCATSPIRHRPEQPNKRKPTGGPRKTLVITDEASAPGPVQAQATTYQRRLSLSQQASDVANVASPLRGPRERRIEIVLPRMMNKLRKAYSRISLEQSVEPEHATKGQFPSIAILSDPASVSLSQEAASETCELPSVRNSLDGTEVIGDDASPHPQDESYQHENIAPRQHTSTETSGADVLKSASKSQRLTTAPDSQESSTRRSTRACKPMEFYGAMKWPKPRQRQKTTSDTNSEYPESSSQSTSDYPQNHQSTNDLDDASDGEIGPLDVAAALPITDSAGVENEPTADATDDDSESMVFDQDTRETPVEDTHQDTEVQITTFTIPKSPTLPSTTVEILAPVEPDSEHMDENESKTPDLSGIGPNGYDRPRTPSILQESPVACIQESPYGVAITTLMNLTPSPNTFHKYLSNLEASAASNANITLSPNPNVSQDAAVVNSSSALGDDPRFEVSSAEEYSSTTTPDEPAVSVDETEQAESDTFFTPQGGSYSPSLGASGSPELGVPIAPLETSELVARLAETRAEQVTDATERSLSPYGRSASPELGTEILHPEITPHTSSRNASLSPLKTPTKPRTPKAVVKKTPLPDLGPRTPSTKKKSSMKSPFPDLAGDEDDEDELTLLGPAPHPSSSFTPTRSVRRTTLPFRPPSRPSLTPINKTTTSKRKQSLRTEAVTTPPKILSAMTQLPLPGRSVAPATDSRRGAASGTDGSGKSGRGRPPKTRPAAAHSSPLARTVANRLLLGMPPISPRRRNTPTSSRKNSTPSFSRSGSVVRSSPERCGVGGYICDRDFCFNCCK